ncbi:aprataxin-like [Tropilaelaps mercedesae]|uniref:Aprataxin-like n=1 Tax=Tropilaelaps mercedesae TaxID=418985 RepID=A0A1V9X262_9ACAR|nr:aprataxin-like [Tropilaelaps mercedesae]
MHAELNLSSIKTAVRDKLTSVIRAAKPGPVRVLCRDIESQSGDPIMAKRGAEDRSPPRKRRLPLPGLRHAMSQEENQIYADDVCVAIADKYPKARYHWLVLPKQDIPTITSLRTSHLPLLEHLDKVGRKLIVNRQLSEKEFRLGYHAVPSMVQLHLHVISQDFNSPSLKTKKHWNSFTTDFFVDSAKLVKAIRENGSFPGVERRIADELLKKDLKCHRCGNKPKTMPQLKEHLKTHL